MIKKITNLVEGACKKKTNYFGYRAWTDHILLVAANAKKLAKKLKADEEIVEIAALLHDYAGILDIKLYPNHHIHGAKIAEKILSKHNYPKNKIQRVARCIYCHRASKNIRKKTLEERILANADAMAHFDNIPSLLYLAFVNYGMDNEEGKKWVLKKLERSYKKLTLLQAKKIIRPKYGAAKIILK